MRSSTLILFGASLFFFLASAGGSWYMLSRISTMEATLSDARIELKREEERQRMILDVKRNLKRLEAERAELAQYFFKEEEIVKLIEQLENLARHANVDLDVTTATAAGTEKKRIFRVGTKVTGTWQNALYYILLIETLPLRINVTDVGLIGDQNGNQWSGDLAFDLLSFVPSTSAR